MFINSVSFSANGGPKTQPARDVLNAGAMQSKDCGPGYVTRQLGRVQVRLVYVAFEANSCETVPTAAQRRLPSSVIISFNQRYEGEGSKCPFRTTSCQPLFRIPAKPGEFKQWRFLNDLFMNLPLGARGRVGQSFKNIIVL